MKHKLKYKLPVVMISQEKAIFLSKRFLPIGYSISKSFPLLKQTLIEAGIDDLEPIEYLAVGFVSTLLIFILLASLFGLIIFVAYQKMLLTDQLLFLLIISMIVIPFIYLLYFISYPKLLATRRQALIEEKLVFAIRNIMIKVRSGVSLFNAILDVASGDYGLVSEEFKIVVEEIESGISQETALEHLSMRTSSPSFKRAIDILSNAVKSGSDIAGTLSLINDMLVKKQQTDMISYSAELTPFSMAFMLIAVVFPSLGMSVFIILGAMLHFDVMLLVYGIPAFLIIFMFFFIGLIKSRRPAIGV